ncbi:High-affinity zinc uptake system membrane protein ZnuB [Pontiella desulfatans]|uniref:High-affinity zinc uptake system membrane protein ZnuB n=1 Tax=Pontiella desulfatans TaxID=2750659 RepID=A0A6C2U766_PONDE|nr:metal ABC transporter permease [Pontiella desulfatans]VGO15264.1 High-affinity zinc uptake system membrane protein ZnuB [Pontiella desulfatans]
MADFFQALFQHGFLQHALLAGWLASISCGVVGTYVVTRRITYLAGGIAHCVLGGMGFARYMQVVHGWSFMTPMLGAMLAALLAAFVIGWINIKAKERIDTVISAFWGLGMAAGILFIAKTPGYGEDLMAYLFGNILLVTQRDLLIIGMLDLFIIATSLLFHKQFVAVCFDEEFARLRGINTQFFYFLMLALTALTVVLMVSIVGIVMVIVMLTLPAAIAGRFCLRMGSMMALAAGICALLTFGGLALSYQPDLPAGATIIVLAGFAYLFSLLFKHR